MKTLKLATLALATATILTGCGGGDGGSTAPAKPEHKVFDYVENAPFSLEAYQQIDVSRVYFASVDGESFEVHTTNGAIDEDSQIQINDLAFTNPDLAECSNYAGVFQGAIGTYFNHLTPEQSDYYEVNGLDADFQGLMLNGMVGGDKVEAASFKFRSEDLLNSEDATPSWGWNGIVDVHQNLGIAFLDLHKGNCHIKQDSWAISSTSAL
ncbi:hypothetical protein L8R85_02185 [Vibrio splendidus]|uniref:Lipoprotein n=2 Tax=Vibrio TaxID=662 RepID=A0A4R3P854_9VIBR|nr:MULTISPECIES: hypothetical protein [Vibrio]MDH5919825.1 hypothetical protein [Vibrio splendidus]TCN05636.1 hypothetical protein EDB35_116134 [Vibrio crassostreae]TCT46142.1 hypothetical protein EDB39_11414 [Vibrio crassostreae]TCT54251.1 hypothetical protein EDB40_114138 [Vibrio crassostreae]TCT58882.1 hypothetical protein EDB44_11817 [Vibrio crassostreae]